MCRDLVEVCGDRVLWEYSDVTKACYDVGRAGVRDSRNEDRCFARYEECVSDCDYFAYWLSYYDAGVDSRADSSSNDSSSSEGTSSDAMSPSSDTSENTVSDASDAHRDAGDAATE
jgi:hypothetical protein